MIKIKRICSLGHDETELSLEEARKVLAEGAGCYMIVKDNAIISVGNLKDGDQIVLVPIIKGG